MASPATPASSSAASTASSAAAASAFAAARSDGFRSHGSKWLVPLNSTTEQEIGSVRRVSMTSAMGTSLNVGIVSGAPGLTMEWSNAPLASRAP